MIDIFIKSYPKDFNLLYYALMSIDKNVTGYNQLQLVLPLGSNEQFKPPIVPKNLVIHWEQEEGNGYMFQQYCKMTAYKYSNADYILFSDSDCIFHEPIDVSTRINNGKPEILYTHYDKVGNGNIWKKPTEKFVNQPIEYELMRRNCLTYHRSTLVNIAAQYPNLKQIILSSSMFSEFNAIGAWAYLHEHEKYTFTNTDHWDYTEPIAIQLWSYFDKNGSDTHKYEYNRAIEAINKALGLNLTDI